MVRVSNQSSWLCGKAQIKINCKCSLMLTGGNTAKLLYRHLAVSQPWDHREVKYYFGDERCVSPDHPDSNSCMVRQTLFSEGISDGCAFTIMEGDAADREAAAKNYDQLLSESIDILLLSVGPEGRIASLFPGNSALQQKTRSVVSVVGPKPPPERLTITPNEIYSVKSICLFTRG